MRIQNFDQASPADGELLACGSDTVGVGLNGNPGRLKANCTGLLVRADEPQLTANVPDDRVPCEFRFFYLGLGGRNGGPSLPRTVDFVVERQALE